jgi:hypothetical protein
MTQFWFCTTTQNTQVLTLGFQLLIENKFVASIITNNNQVMISTVYRLQALCIRTTLQQYKSYCANLAVGAKILNWYATETSQRCYHQAMPLVRVLRHANGWQLRNVRTACGSNGSQLLPPLDWCSK